MQRVQLNLERLLPELRDLEKKKIFTKSEISEIVKRRTAYETALIRKGSNEQDWIQYIEYEKKLEQLRRLRASSMKIQGRPTVSDYSVARHILALYASATKKMPGSVKIWQAYISHVLRSSNSGPEISRVLARALSLHPTDSSIWILAIRFESDGTGPQAKEGGVGGGNIDAARKLCLRALRFMKGATQQDAIAIWLEWIRLEISFVERMRKRWEILGLESTMPGPVNVVSTDMEMNVLQEEDEESKEALDKIEETVSDERQKGKNAVLDGAIVRIVIENAISALRTDPSIYASMLNLIRPLPTPLRHAFLAQIHDALRDNLPDMSRPRPYVSSIRMIARRHLDDLAVPSKDGLSLNPVAIDSESWIDAVDQVCSDFDFYSRRKRDEASANVLEEFAEFLNEITSQTEDANLKEYLAAQKDRIRRHADKVGYECLALQDNS